MTHCSCAIKRSAVGMTIFEGLAACRLKVKRVRKWITTPVEVSDRRKKQVHAVHSLSKARHMLLEAGPQRKVHVPWLCELFVFELTVN